MRRVAGMLGKEYTFGHNFPCYLPNNSIELVQKLANPVERKVFYSTRSEDGWKGKRRWGDAVFLGIGVKVTNSQPFIHRKGVTPEGRIEEKRP